MLLHQRKAVLVVLGLALVAPRCSQLSPERAAIEVRVPVAVAVAAGRGLAASGPVDEVVCCLRTGCTGRARAQQGAAISAASRTCAPAPSRLACSISRACTNSLPRADQCWQVSGHALGAPVEAKHSTGRSVESCGWTHLTCCRPASAGGTLPCWRKAAGLMVAFSELGQNQRPQALEAACAQHAGSGEATHPTGASFQTQRARVGAAKLVISSLTSW